MPQTANYVEIFVTIKNLKGHVKVFFWYSMLVVECFSSAKIVPLILVGLVTNFVKKNVLYGF